MIKRTLQMMNYGLFAVVLAWPGTSAVANDVVYPSDSLLVGGQSMGDLMENYYTKVFTWKSYPDFNNMEHVHIMEPRRGREFVAETIPADTYIYVPRMAVMNWQGATESPCLDEDAPFVEWSRHGNEEVPPHPGLESSLEDFDYRMWFNSEPMEDFDWDEARHDTLHKVLYRPFKQGSCLDPAISAEGRVIERQAGTAGFGFLFPPLEPGVTTFEYIGNSTGARVTREFTVLDGLIGDLDRSGSLDTADIDMISDAIREGSVDLLFDRDRNGIVNSDDRTYLIKDSLNTYFGDANLDGVVDFPDFLALSEAFGDEGGWGNGDFDGDGSIAFPDFLFLSTNFGNGVEAAAVPEPSGICLAMFGILGLMGFRRRR